MKKTLLIVFSALFLGFSLIFSSLIISSKSKPVNPSHVPQSTQSVINKGTQSGVLSASYQTTKVTRVIDGDTIEIEGGLKVRYIGIDTPETVSPSKPIQCFGIEASNKNKELVDGKEIGLEKDVSETDRYGRLLRYVYLPAGEAGVDDILVNDYLVRQGYAHASSYPPDIKYQDQFVGAQQEAQANNRGLWSGCGSDANQQTANPSLSTSTNSQQPGCIIKGNISSSGEKIYHMPGQQYYDKTVIDPSSGERWFCTEDEAVSSGWRKSKNN